MALPDKSSSDAESETAKDKSRLIQEKQESFQLLANENDLSDSDSEHLSTKDSTKEINVAGPSTVEEGSKTIVGSPPECEPSLLENYKTPHSQRRTIQLQKKKLHEDSFNSGPLSNLRIQSDKYDQRKIPGVIKKWPGCVEVWLNMVYNEEATLRSRNARNFNSGSHTGSAFLPRMRAILVDWIMEVCDVYQLRRNTYYLAVDYIDRFLDHRRSIPKTQLQLVGVTCLFIAAKIEEIYPPKLSEFTYVCDGACTEKEILTCERLVLHSLEWDVNPMTPTTWLNLYMQIATMPTNVPQQLQQQHALVDDSSNDVNPTSTEIYFPVYSAYQFVRASQVMDLFSLDPAYARFTYSVIAAAAMFLECGKTPALDASGFNRDHIDLCLAHMSFFHTVLSNENNPRLLSVLGNLTMNSFSTSSNNDTADESQAASYRAIRAAVPNLVRDEKHSMQTHCVDLDYYERAVVLRLEWLGFKVSKMYTKQYNTKNENPPIDAPCNNCDSTTTTCECNNVDDADQKHVEDNKKAEGGEEEPPDFSTVVTFQLERLWNLGDDDNNDVVSDEYNPSTNSEGIVESEEKASRHNNNIFALSIFEKLLVNFDGILSSVHLDCSDKMFLSLWRQTNTL